MAIPPCFSGHARLRTYRDYFATVGAQLREGRFFDASDRKSNSPVAIINEPLANREFPGRSPLGQRLKFGELDGYGHWYTVIGVMKQIRESGVLLDAKPAIYRVLEQCDQVTERLSIGMLVRTAVEPASIIPSVRQAIWSIDRNQAVARIQTMEEIVDRQLQRLRKHALLGASLACTVLHRWTLRSTFLRRDQRTTDRCGCVRRETSEILLPSVNEAWP